VIKNPLSLPTSSRLLSAATHLIYFYSVMVNLYWVPALLSWLIVMSTYLAMRGSSSPVPERRRSGWSATAITILGACFYEAKKKAIPTTCCQ